MLSCRASFSWALACLAALGFSERSILAKDPVSAEHGMVVAQEPTAADVGLNVLKTGGNAVDAAVAVGFALAVTHPVAGNLGGGGFMLVRMADGRTDFLDFRESAPGKASRDMYLDKDGNATKDSIFGWRSSGVPGSVAGLEFAQKKFGTKPWSDLLNPAVKLAADGITVSGPVAASLAGQHNPLWQDPESKRIFLRDGSPYKGGEVLKQPELSQTLARIAKFGSADFYHGETAKRLASEMASHGGLVTAEDLANYKVVERSPLLGKYRGYNVITAPPPSAGGIGLLQIMGMLEGTGYAGDGPDSIKAVHFEAEAMRRYYADRSAYLGDPDFYNVPLRQLLQPAYLEATTEDHRPREGDAQCSRRTRAAALGRGSDRVARKRSNDALQRRGQKR